MTQAALTDRFVALLAALTGFSEFQLRGAGQTELHHAIAEFPAGHANLSALLDAFDGIAGSTGGSETDRDGLLRRGVLSDERLGPLARKHRQSLVREHLAPAAL